jgi:predicted flap endonuclease-1-like 5' DNA nuclease
MPHKISEIKGMDTAMQAKFAAANIATVEQLLAQSGTPAQRGTLAAQLGTTPAALTEWVNRADLMRLKGVGTEFANLLEECGVDSCKELQHRVAANLQVKLKNVNDEKRVTHHAPTLAQVEEWIQEAATLSAQ